MRTLLFLDFDDVLNNRDRYKHAFVIEDYLVHGRSHPAKFRKSVMDAFTPEAKDTYRWIVDNYDPTIVISSSWANHFAENHFHKIFMINNMCLKLYENEFMTRRNLDNANNRYTQILDFIDRHSGEFDKYLILDDTSSGESLIGSDLQKYTVFCDCENQETLEVVDKLSLSEVHKQYIINILGELSK